jgi:hypothetical protein
VIDEDIDQPGSNGFFVFNNQEPDLALHALFVLPGSAWRTATNDTSLTLSVEYY